MYVENNPLKYIDPDGKDGIAVFNIDDKGNVSITVNVNIYIYGSGVSSSVANQIQTNMMNDWNQGWTYKDSDTGQEYTVSFNVNVDVYDKKNSSEGPGFFSNKNNSFNRDNFIEIGANATDVARSYVRSGDEGKWRGYGTDPSSHEFGHLIGLKDRYTDASGADLSWAGNIMAEPAGAGIVEQKNIDALAAPLVKSFNYQKNKSYVQKDILYQRIYNVQINENRPKW